MRIPPRVRTGLREKLWAIADQIDWVRLDWYEKAARYEAWTKDPEVGGVLVNFMDQRQVRVYVKDTIMKGYVRSRQGLDVRPMHVLGIAPDGPFAESYERPHGRRLADGRVIAWGTAEDWKLVLMAVYERAWSASGARPFGAALMHASGRYADNRVRLMVKEAAAKLGIERLIWID